MTEPAANDLDVLLADFARDVAAHRPLLARLHATLAPKDAPTDTPFVPPPLEESLKAFDLDVRQAARLAADPGWAGDFIIFLSATLKRVDPSLRAEFPVLNAFVESVVVVPGVPLLVGLLLTLAEGPLLSLVESWLAAKADALLAAERSAG